MTHVTNNMHAKSVSKCLVKQKPLEPVKVSKSSKGECCEGRSTEIEKFLFHFCLYCLAPHLNKLCFECLDLICSVELIFFAVLYFTSILAYLY
jgi:hypothetical protein